MKTSLGFVGLGLMGTPMVKRLLAGGFHVSVFNRTKAKADEVVELGARWCSSPEEVAAEAEVVFSMVSNSEALLSIAIENHGILHGLRREKVHVDCSTVSPAMTRRLGAEYKKHGRSFLHSPVLGSVPQAADGSLLLFTGGDQSAFTLAAPALNVLGSKIWRFDNPEQASHAKLLCNLFIAGMATTLAQALVFAEKADVDPSTLLDIIAHSSLNAPTYQTKGKSILERNFTPRFYAEHLLKDINLILDAAAAAKVSLPTVPPAQQLFSETVKSGFGREDYSAVVKIIEAMAGIGGKK
ncbi:MAG TPA: NAD(P)-dependent oxidoreductase [Bacteroidota bacterium]|nr:NAD(P)-dependent oxidoreductase [Bacteroidota bacterium]